MIPDRSHRLAAAMMLGSAFMGTLESVFLSAIPQCLPDGTPLDARSASLLVLMAVAEPCRPG